MNPLATPPLPLKDIHLPPPPGIWPLAPGWWVLIAVAGLLLFIGGRWLWRRYRQRAYRRRLRVLFDQSLASTADSATRLAIISQLLRRAARAASGDATGQLMGEPWLQFLDGEDPAKPFTQGPGRALLTGPFAANPVSAAVIDALEPIVRRRFMQLAMTGYRRDLRRSPDDRRNRLRAAPPEHGDV